MRHIDARLPINLGKGVKLLSATTLLGAAVLSVSAGRLLAAPPAQGAGAADPKQQADISKALSKKELSNVRGNLQNGIVVLTGTVDVFDQKLEADRRVHHIKGIKGVDNEIEVSGPEVPDAVLEQKLVKALEYDRVGYGTTAFNAIGVRVQNGVVTLGGHAYGPVDADSAFSVASNTKGVREVINDIQLDPLSPMDDQIRLQAYRTIYGFAMLNRYAVDPGKPIRISVANGNLTLYGVVDTQADKDAAGIRANTVPGVFKVVNNLQVARQTERKS